MQLLNRCRTVAGIAFAALLVSATASRAEVIADVGTLVLGVADTIGCSITTCTTTAGSAGGALPASGTFVHQIVFRVPLSADAINSTQVLDNTKIDVANMTVQLFLQTGGSIALGGTATGNLLATAISSTLASTTNFFLSFAGLQPGNVYFIQVTGGGLGVTGNGASWGDQLSAVAAVPLPPALFLLAAALTGFVGYARIRRGKASA